MHTPPPAMKIMPTIMACLLLSSCGSEMRRAEKMAQDQQLDTPVTVTVTSPPFDEAYAKAALAKGNSTIKGVVFHKIINGGKQAGRDAPILNFSKGSPMPGVMVYLYPATEHVKEIVRLESENRSQRSWRKVQLKRFVGDPRLSQYALTTKTDGNGLFEFTEMRPGNYLIYVENMLISSSGQETIPVGTRYETAGYVVSRHGVTDVPRLVVQTEEQHFRVKTEVGFNEIVNVPANNTVVKMEARMRPF